MTHKRFRPKLHRLSLGLPALAAASTLLPGLDLRAEGFRNPPPGAAALGRSGARTAQVDDPSAAFHNPANLPLNGGFAVQASPTIVYIKANYEDGAGNTARTSEPWKMLPNLFAVAPLIEDKLYAGLAVTTPYGLSNEWEQSGAFGPGGTLRYAAPHHAEMVTVNTSPTLAWKINEHLSIGGGLNAYWSELTLKQFYPWAPWGAPGEAELKAKGDGWAYGGIAAATWNFNERHTVAATYRSGPTIDYSGDFRLSNVAPAAAGAGVTGSSPFGSEVALPDIVGVGYGWNICETVRVGADFEWLRFSNFQELPINIANNAILLPSSAIPQNWRDTFTLGLGGDWRFAPRWTASGSYQFYKSPVREFTYSPTIPDADQNAVTLGLRYKAGGHAAEIAWGGIFYNDRNISSNQTSAFNGKYEVVVHLVSLGYTYRF